MNIKMLVAVVIMELFLEVRVTFPNMLSSHFLDVLLNI